MIDLACLLDATDMISLAKEHSTFWSRYSSITWSWNSRVRCTWLDQAVGTNILDHLAEDHAQLPNHVAKGLGSIAPSSAQSQIESLTGMTCSADMMLQHMRSINLRQQVQNLQTAPNAPKPSFMRDFSESTTMLLAVKDTTCVLLAPTATANAPAAAANVMSGQRGAKALLLDADSPQ